jgi:hypothetical protein
MKSSHLGNPVAALLPAVSKTVVAQNLRPSILVLTLGFSVAIALQPFGLNSVSAHPPKLGAVAMTHPAHPVATPKVKPVPQHNTPAPQHNTPPVVHPKPPAAPTNVSGKPIAPPVKTGGTNGEAPIKAPKMAGQVAPLKPIGGPLPPKVHPTTHPGGLPTSPGGVSTPRGGPIVATMMRIGWKELDRHRDRCWHGCRRPPTTDSGTGNTFSATNTYSPTIENSGNTNTDNSKPIPKTDDGVTRSAPKQESKDGKGDQTEQANGADKKDRAQEEGQDLFDNARASFKQGDYDKALEQVGAAIENHPNVASLHEFKALCYFAQRKYKEAAPALYAVISAGPGWDMDTVKSFYPNQDTYLKQLDALKSFVEQEPNQAYGHFVLAYHYLTRGSTMLAKKQLQEVRRLQPDDKLSEAILKVL